MVSKIKSKLRHDLEDKLVDNHIARLESEKIREKKRGLNALPEGLFSKEAEMILLGEKPPPTSTGPKVSFL
jgi:hypothetical protein